MHILMVVPGWPQDSFWVVLYYKFPPLAAAQLAGMTPSRHRLTYVDESLAPVDLTLEPDLAAITVMTHGDDQRVVRRPAGHRGDPPGRLRVRLRDRRHFLPPPDHGPAGHPVPRRGPGRGPDREDRPLSVRLHAPHHAQSTAHPGGDQGAPGQVPPEDGPRSWPGT